MVDNGASETMSTSKSTHGKALPDIEMGLKKTINNWETVPNVDKNAPLNCVNGIKWNQCPQFSH